MDFALKVWRHHLYGARYHIFSDHETLKYLFDAYLKEFDFDLKYHKGKANVVANALSRKTLLKAELMMQSAICNTTNT